eukprot:7993346-Ditylum_brightwellii.AAC.1
MAVHPLYEVWSVPHQELICCMCDIGMGEENQGEEKISFSTPPHALDIFEDTSKVVQDKRGKRDEKNSAPAQKA